MIVSLQAAEVSGTGLGVEVLGGGWDLGDWLPVDAVVGLAGGFGKLKPCAITVWGGGRVLPEPVWFAVGVGHDGFGVGVAHGGECGSVGGDHVHCVSPGLWLPCADNGTGMVGHGQGIAVPFWEDFGKSAANTAFAGRCTLQLIIFDCSSLWGGWCPGFPP